MASLADFTNANFASMPTPDICERARASRDARFDGLFFTAVRSTGIFCRPVCPAPTPRRDRIVWFPTAAAASAAGFRPCLRCRPELSPDVRARDADDAVARALALIAEGALQDGSVTGLAARVGVGARQLRRLFLARVGATPLTVHATRRLLLAKQLLTESSLPVTQIAWAAGFNSLRRFNAAFHAGCGMAPGVLRKRPAAGRQTTLRLRLGFRPPFAFAEMLAFLRARAIPGVERVGEDRYERILGPTAAPTRICVTHDPDRPELLLDVEHADPRAIQGIIRRVRRLFDLDADLAAVCATLSSDPLLARAIHRRPGLRVPGGWDGFEIAVRAVLGQQVSVKAATTFAQRVVAAFGDRYASDDAGLDRRFPTPARLRDAPLESIGLPARRAATLRGLAAAVDAGRVGFHAGQRLDTFATALCALPGIGAWTANYIAMRALGHPDAFPAGDLVVQQVLGSGKRMDERATAARSRAWQPWRAYAVIHLWRMAQDDSQ